MERKRDRKKRMRAGMLALLMLLVTAFELRSPVTVEAAKDKTKPTAIVYLNKTDYTGGSVYVQVYASDKSGIKSILIKKGNISKTASKYWKNATNITKAKKKKVTENAVYSVKVTDKAGNATIKKITIMNIDKKKPSVSVSQKNTGGGVLVTVKASDASGIKSIKWIKGAIADAGSVKFNKAANITSAKQFLATSNGYYTVQVIDKAGNKAVKQIQVKVKQALYDLDEYYGNVSSYNKCVSVTDSLGRSYTNALRLVGSTRGMKYTYLLNGAYQYIEGDIACHKSDNYDGVMQIYADGELVFTSSTLTARGGAVHFKVDIANAKFIDILVTADDDYGSRDYILGNCYLYN